MLIRELLRFDLAPGGRRVAFAHTEVRVTPEQATGKWVSRLQAATQEMTQGVARVTVAPGAQAAAKYDKWLAGIQANADKWRRNVGAVTVDQWKSSMTTIGIPRVAQGASAKQGKYAAFAQDFYPFLSRVMAAAARMPDTSLEDRIAKSGFVQRELSKYRRSGSSGVGAMPSAA